MRDVLTPRQVEVLRLVVDGFGNGAIAAYLGLSAGTVKSHLQAAFRRLGVSSRTGAVVAAHRRGYIDLRAAAPREKEVAPMGER